MKKLIWRFWDLVTLYDRFLSAFEASFWLWICSVDDIPLRMHLDIQKFKKPEWKIFSSDEQQFLFNLGQTILVFLREFLVEKKIVLKESFPEIFLITTVLLLYFKTFHQFTFSNNRDYLGKFRKLLFLLCFLVIDGSKKLENSIDRKFMKSQVQI